MSESLSEKKSEALGRRDSLGYERVSEGFDPSFLKVLPTVSQEGLSIVELNKYWWQ